MLISSRYLHGATYPVLTPIKISSVWSNKLASPDDSYTWLHSCLQGVSGSRAYIATQGPLPHTVGDFLRMIWEYEIKVRTPEDTAKSSSTRSIFLNVSFSMRNRHEFKNVGYSIFNGLHWLIVVLWVFRDSDCHLCLKVVVMACREFEMGKVGGCSLQTTQLLHFFFSP